MESMELQHIQIFRALMQGFIKAEGNGIQYLDLSTEELRQKDLRQLETRPPLFHDREMEQFLHNQQDEPVADLLEKCRQACNTPQEKLPLFQNELLALRMFLRYLLKRAEGICQGSESQDFQPQLLSTGHMLNMPVSQASSPEEYYPILYVNKSAVDFLIPYTGAYATRSLFDSMSYALPISMRGMLVFVHTSLHKYFYDGLALTVQVLEDDAVALRMNDEAVESECQSGARLIVGGQNELRRIQKYMQQKHKAGNAVELELG